MRFNKKRAFTLIELIIVIAILGILAAILVPTLSSSMKNAKIGSCVSNATQLTKQLKIDAVTDKVAYYDTVEVIAKANEIGFTLDENIEGYSYWYDAASNAVHYTKNDTVLGSGSLSIRSYANNVAYADSISSIPIVPESFCPYNPALRYIDQSPNVFTEMVSTIYNLVDNCAGDINVMKSTFDSIKQDVATKNETVATYFESNFSTEKCVYISDKHGIVFSEEAKKLAENADGFKNAVVSAQAKMLIASDAEVKIVNPIVIPGKVTLTANCLKNVQATVVTLAPATINVGTHITIDRKQGEVVGKYITIGEGDYAINYGYQKEAQDVHSIVYDAHNAEGGISLGNLDDYNDVENEDVRCEYVVPTLSMDNANDTFRKIDTIRFKSKLVEGGIEYYIIAVDNAFNTYVLQNVGSITEAVLRYTDSPDKHYQDLSISISETVYNFDNLKNKIYYEIEYQPGYGEYETVLSPYGNDYLYFSGNYYWADTKTAQITDVAALTNYHIDLSDEVVAGHTANTANVVKLTAYLENGDDDIALFIRHYDRRYSVSAEESIVVTFDNNLLGDAHITTTQNVYANKNVRLTDTPILRSGYNLVEWNTKADGSGTIYKNKQSVCLNAPLTLYAQWTENEYKLTFTIRRPSESSTTVSSSAKSVSVSVKYSESEAIDLSQFAETFQPYIDQLAAFGFTEFHSWDTSAELTTDNGQLEGNILGVYNLKQRVDDGTVTSLSTTVYARFYGTAHFYANGGVFSDGVTTEKSFDNVFHYAYFKNSGLTADVADVLPTREGYTFAGWYFDAECTKYPSGGTSSTIKSSGIGSSTSCYVLSHYAKWLPIE